MKNQHIVAVHRDYWNYSDDAFKSGIHEFNSDCISYSVILGHRQTLETNPEYRQLIPYVALTNNGKVMVYRRNNGGETRLNNKTSIGFGGHIDLVDVVHHESVVNLGMTVINATHRELREEIASTLELGNLDFHGYILDNTDDVGRVHAGITATMEISNEAVESGESCVDLVGWMTPEEALALGSLETWSVWFAEWLSVR